MEPPRRTRSEDEAVRRRGVQEVGGCTGPPYPGSSPNPEGSTGLPVQAREVGGCAGLAPRTGAVAVLAGQAGAGAETHMDAEHLLPFIPSLPTE